MYARVASWKAVVGMTRQIQVRLHPDGTITGKTIGIKGASCLSALALLESLVDATVTDSAFTREFYEQQNVQVQGNLVDEVGILGN